MSRFLLVLGAALAPWPAFAASMLIQAPGAHNADAAQLAQFHRQCPNISIAEDGKLTVRQASIRPQGTAVVVVRDDFPTNVVLDSVPADTADPAPADARYWAITVPHTPDNAPGMGLIALIRQPPAITNGERCSLTVYEPYRLSNERPG